MNRSYSAAALLQSPRDRRQLTSAARPAIHDAEFAAAATRAVRAVRAWARGQRCHGIAVRIVPNRAVDGWTVRFTPSKNKPPELVIATFADE